MKNECNYELYVNYLFACIIPIPICFDYTTRILNLNDLIIFDEHTLEPDCLIAYHYFLACNIAYMKIICVCLYVKSEWIVKSV